MTTYELRWINIKEQLPPIIHYVLVSYQVEGDYGNGPISIALWYHGWTMLVPYDKVKGKKNAFWGSRNETTMTEHQITHWMPIPWPVGPG